MCPPVRPKRSSIINKKSTSTAPTLVHVARLAGVGLGTASRALSGEGYVHTDTLERIRTAAAQLGYHRNELARSLRVKQSHVVGIVVPDIGGAFMVECVRAAQCAFRRHQYMSVVAFTDGDSAAETEEIGYLLQRQIDGLLVVPADSTAPHFQSPQLASLPIVFFDQPLNKECDAVLVKNRNGARSAVEHLMDHGHKRIACVGVNRHLYSIRKRIEGYREAIKQAELPEYIAVVAPEEIDARIEGWLGMKERPTAIFSLNELSSIKVIEALSARRKRVPEEIAFIGFDEVQLGQYLNPPLSAVVQPATRIGERAALRLLERIKSTETLPGRYILLDTTFIPRGSCGC